MPETGGKYLKNIRQKMNALKQLGNNKNSFDPLISGKLKCIPTGQKKIVCTNKHGSAVAHLDFKATDNETACYNRSEAEGVSGTPDCMS